MEEFKQQLSTFITSLDVFFDGDEIELPEGKIRPDVALIKLNKWLGENKEIISTFPNPKRDPSQTHNSISSIAKQFPVVWAEKDTYNHVFPRFEKETYIEYLSQINNSYKNLPVPNYNPPFQLNNLATFNKNWFKFEDYELFWFLQDKPYNGKDFYHLSYENLLKVTKNCPDLPKFIIKCYNDIMKGKYSLCNEWCSASIAARFKGGDKTNPKQFRPLMVLPILVRLLDSILCTKLHDIILQYGIIDTRVQKAVLKNSSGLWENVFGVNMRINEMMKRDDDNELFLFIDLTNAFGSVNYRTMLTILQKHNFGPEFSLYFERYYKNVSGVYQGTQFKWKNGLFQGSALSNILFLLYIDYTMKNLFQDLKALKLINNSYDLQENSFAFVDDIVMILPKNEKTPKVLHFLNKFLPFYGFEINYKKTYFVIKDQTVDTLEFNKITYHKATKDFAYLGHSLFLFKDEVLGNILEKTEKSLYTIDSFNMSGKIKAYIYYTNIFLRISRILETIFLINGKCELMDRLMEIVTYFVYRWGMSDFEDYGKKHFEYIFTRGSTKLLKCPNLKNYQAIVDKADLEKFHERYGFITDNQMRNQDFSDILGFDCPQLEIMEDNLKTMKSNNYFPIEHFEKTGNCFYADNFVSWIE